MSRTTPLVRTFLALALLTVFAMITLGMSPTWRAAIPALCIWTFLVAAYGAHRVLHTWSAERSAA